MKTKETQPQQFDEARGLAGDDDYGDDDYGDDECCPMCGGDGVVMLSECGPSEWGEDCFCEVDRVVTCPECRNRERYESMRKQQEAKRPNDGTERLEAEHGK